MAGQTYEVDLGDDDLLPPWSTVFEVVGATDAETWVLVGGLMVQLHARRSGVPPPRPTKDVDVVIDVVSKKTTAGSIAAQLSAIGFEPVIPRTKSAAMYRFQRGADQVDIMVPDHLPRWVMPRLRGYPAFEAPAGEQAIRRRDSYVLTTTAAGTFTVQVPDSLGALVAKGAAHIVDNRDSGRHLQDGAVLLASVDSVGAMNLTTLSANDRKRLRHLVAELPDAVPAWDSLGAEDRRRGQQNRERLVIAARL